MPALLLAVLALLAPQDPPVREKASGFTFVLPKGWTRQNVDGMAAAMIPPGGNGQDCAVGILPGDEEKLSEKEFHDRVVNSVILTKAPFNEPERSTVGVWRVSHLKVLAAVDKAAWISVYTAKSGKRGETLLFFAATEALVKMHRPAVDRMVAGIEFPDVAGAITAHGLTIPLPAGWTRKDDPTGSVALTPPADQLPSGYLLLVLPPNKLPGLHWEAHKQMVKALIDQAQWTGGEPVTAHRPDGPGIFIKTEAAGRTASGEGRALTLFTAVHDGVMEAVLGVHSIDRNVVDPMLKATTFKEPPKPAVRPKIVEAYRRMNQRMVLNRDGGAPTAGSLLYDRIWLRSDGTADFATVYAEGYAASPLVFKTDAALLNGEYGSWKEAGGKIQILRGAGAAVQACERISGGLRAFGSDWQAMPRVDGLKLSGRWELKSPPEERISPWHLWIEFTPEGRFKTDGALKHVAANDFERPKPPDRGAGTYEVRDWTMVFTFDDGSSWSTDFSTLGKEMDPEGSILFRTVVFPKSK